MGTAHLKFYDPIPKISVFPDSVKFDGKFTLGALETLLKRFNVRRPELSWDTIPKLMTAIDEDKWRQRYEISTTKESTLTKALLYHLQGMGKFPVIIPGLFMVADMQVLSFEKMGKPISIHITDPLPIVTNGEYSGLYNAHLETQDSLLSVIIDISLDPAAKTMDIAKNRIFTRAITLEYAASIRAIPSRPFASRVVQSDANYMIQDRVDGAGGRHMDIINGPVSTFISKTSGSIYSASDYIHKKLYSSANYYANSIEILVNMDQVITAYVTTLSIPPDGQNFFWPVLAGVKDFVLVRSPVGTGGPKGTGSEGPEKEFSYNPFSSFYVYKWGCDSPIVNLGNYFEKSMVAPKDPNNIPESVVQWAIPILIKTYTGKPTGWIANVTREYLRSLFMYLISQAIDIELQSLTETLEIRRRLKEDIERMITRFINYE